MSKVTVVVLTKNEEKNIAAVVQNAKKVAAEVLTVDSGSTDKTVQLAEENGARVVYRAWDNDFSAQRNFALQHVKTEWVLYLDADERMNDELCCAIEKAMATKAQKQYSIMRKIHAFGFTYKHGIFKPDEVLRLFPVNKVHWENKVHERPVCDLPKEKLAGQAGHYTTIWAEDNFAKGKRTSLAACFAHSAYGFLRAYILQLGFIDGWSGLYSSLQHFIYTMMKYLKLYELQKAKSN